MTPHSDMAGGYTSRGRNDEDGGRGGDLFSRKIFPMSELQVSNVL